MSEVRLDQVLERLPSGLPVPVGCWLVGRVASCIAAQPRPVTPMEVRIREDGGVRVADPARDVLPFAYRAPEVIRGSAESSRSAVFTLGVLLVETVTGRSPFGRGSDMETRIAVAEEHVPPLSGRVGQASARLDGIMAAALAKDPAARPSSTVELAERLDGFLDEELFDVGPEELATTVRAAFAGVDLWTAMRDPGSVVAPLPSAPASERAGGRGRKAAAAESAAARPVRGPSPGPSREREGGSSSPVSAGASVDGNAARAARGPSPGPSREREGGSSSPVSAGASVDGNAARAARGPSPGPSREREGGPSRPASAGGGLQFEEAELDLRPEGRRTSAPNKPRLDEEVVRLGDPLQTAGGAGITDASVTGVQARDEQPDRPRTAAGVLDIDQRAFAQERQRPATMIDDEPPPEPGPNWVKRISIALVVLLAAAIAYQYLLRPLLRE